MTERELIAARREAVQARIKRRAAAINERLERAAEPAIREHPLLTLAAGASTGLLLGSVVAGSASGPSSRGGGGFVKNTLVAVARTAALRTMLADDEATAAPTPETGTPESA